jgi:hypothetical protein
MPKEHDRESVEFELTIKAYSRKLELSRVILIERREAQNKVKTTKTIKLNRLKE